MGWLLTPEPRIDEVYAISKKEGYAQIYSASDKPLVKSLYDAGDQLGQLWIQNILWEAIMKLVFLLEEKSMEYALVN